MSRTPPPRTTPPDVTAEWLAHSTVLGQPRREPPGPLLFMTETQELLRATPDLMEVVGWVLIDDGYVYLVRASRRAGMPRNSMLQYDIIGVATPPAGTDPQ